MSTAVSPNGSDAGPSDLVIRPARPEDAGEAGRIIYEAFGAIHDAHAFPRDFPVPEAAAGVAEALIAHPGIHGVVAERDGRILGSNFVDERGSIRGVGPITVDPAVQERGIGRRLMEAVLNRSNGAEGVRLLQDTFNTRSMALYATLGFEITDPVALMGGTIEAAVPEGYEVRELTEADLPAAAELSLAVHGYERTAELADALAHRPGESYAAIRDGMLAAYGTTLTFFPGAHAVADGTEAMTALLAGALAGAEASFLLPTRQHELFRWALAGGLRVVKPMTYMVRGHHREPAGAWIPSVLY